MPVTRIEVTREQIVSYRRRASSLDERLPPGAQSLRRAAHAGLQDSMPRAALLSIHARVRGTDPTTWTDPALVQVWGPRFSAYVVAAGDHAPFTLGRLADPGPKRRLEEEMADRLETFLAGRRMDYGDAGHALGINPNALRYAAPTGRVLIRWDGARGTAVWTVPAPTIDPFEARLELARRYLHVLGPGTAAGFERWAGIRPQRAHAAFEALAGELAPVRTPIGDAWILARDEADLRRVVGGAGPATDGGVAGGARFLPSGDTFFLLQGRERELLVPHPGHRAELWTPRVWPGALLLRGDIAGTWRRAGPRVTVRPWRPLLPHEREMVEVEAASLPIAGAEGLIRVAWETVG